MRKKKKEPYCKNCLLYNGVDGLCSVVVLYNGERMNLPVSAEDKCFFEEEFIAIDGDKVDKFKPEVQQVKWWCEDDSGKKSKKGKVKIEYPTGFFGEPE